MRLRAKAIFFIVYITLFPVLFHVVSLHFIDDDNETYLSVMMDRLELGYRILRDDVAIGGERPSDGLSPIWTKLAFNILLSAYYIKNYGYTEILDRIDIPWLLNYLANRQSKFGDFAPLYFDPIDNRTLGGFLVQYTYFSLLALKLWDSLDLINVTAVHNFALSRYNNETGGFKEQIIRVGDINYTINGFYGVYTPRYDLYKVPNIVSTYLYVAILNITDGLDLIDIDRVAAFVLDCLNEDNLFGPTRNATSFNGSTIVPAIDHFLVDGYGSSLAYNFAGVLTLAHLNRLNTLSLEVKSGIVSYVMGLRCELCRFALMSDLLDNNNEDETGELNVLYAVSILKTLGFADEHQKELEESIKRYISKNMKLLYDNTFPIPKLIDSENYGTIIYNGLYGFNEYLIILPAAMINAFNILNSPTPRAIKTITNFTMLGLVLDFVTSIAVAVMLHKLGG